MTENKNNKHLFSIHVENLSGLINSLETDQTFSIQDKNAHQRLTQVLRLKTDDSVTFFDEVNNIKCKVLEKTFQNKKVLYAKILEKNENKPLEPSVILCPCIVKKSSFEKIIYTAASMGANVIRPVISEKVHKIWTEKKERLEKIMIAACEQSKNYILPELHNPVKFPVFMKSVENILAKKIIFDPKGRNTIDLVDELKSHKMGKICLFFGPEGGLTTREYQLLQTKEFEPFSLTPTILRSESAVNLGLGLVRSILKDT